MKQQTFIRIQQGPLRSIARAQKLIVGANEQDDAESWANEFDYEALETNALHKLIAFVLKSRLWSQFKKGKSTVSIGFRFTAFSQGHH